MKNPPPSVSLPSPDSGDSFWRHIRRGMLIGVGLALGGPIGAAIASGLSSDGDSAGGGVDIS